MCNCAEYAKYAGPNEGSPFRGFVESEEEFWLKLKAERAKERERDRKWKHLIERDGEKCFYCDGPAETLDHVIAKSNGGKRTVSNLVLSCRKCNNYKANRSVTEFVMAVYRERVAKEKQEEIELSLQEQLWIARIAHERRKARCIGKALG